MTPEQLAQLFHETYERLAPEHGYETRKESAKPWAEVPQQNKDLMIAVCAEILGKIYNEQAKTYRKNPFYVEWPGSENAV